MQDRMRVCAHCSRHVFAREVSCPFCGAKPISAAKSVAAVAALVGAGLAAVACGDKPAQGPANVPAVEDAGVTPPPAPTAGIDGGRGEQEPAAIYGGPPPR